MCECGHGIENIQYFLLLYKIYEESRNEEVGGRNMRLENLFDDPKIVKSMLEYIEKTNRFNFELKIRSIDL